MSPFVYNRWDAWGDSSEDESDVGERPQLLLQPGWELREVRGNHNKSCSGCGKNDWGFGEYYVCYSFQPRGSDKYCVDCAETYVGDLESSDEFPDEDSEETFEEDEEPEERSLEDRPEESRGTVPNSSNVTSESAKRQREDEPEDGGDAAAKQTRRVA